MRVCAGIAVGCRPMNLWRYTLSWYDDLRWYERGCLLVVWLGQFLLGICLAIAIGIIVLDFEHDVLDGILAILLPGFAIFCATRSLLVVAVAHRTRRHRRRRVHAGQMGVR
jgi:hypothetical protein